MEKNYIIEFQSKLTLLKKFVSADNYRSGKVTEHNIFHDDEVMTNCIREPFERMIRKAEDEIDNSMKNKTNDDDCDEDTIIWSQKNSATLDSDFSQSQESKR